MATETIVTVAADATYSQAGDLILSPEERRLLQRSTTSWVIAPWLNAIEAGGIADAKTGAYAFPVTASVFPSRVS